MSYIRLFQVVSIWISIIIPTVLSFAQEPHIFEGSPFRIVDYDFVTIYVVASFSVTFVSEYLVIVLFLWKEKKVWPRLFFWILLANVITSPLSQIAMVFLEYGGLSEILPVTRDQRLANAAMWLIALLTVIPKYNILKWATGQMHRQGMLNESMPHERILTIVIIAVFVSFVLGSFSGDIAAMTICFPEPVGYYSFAQFPRR